VYLRVVGYASRITANGDDGAVNTSRGSGGRIAAIIDQEARPTIEAVSHAGGVTTGS
jgi:hypothetical protein